MWLPIANIEHAAQQVIPIVASPYQVVNERKTNINKIKFNSPLIARYIQIQNSFQNNKYFNNFDCGIEIKYDYQSETFNAYFSYSQDDKFLSIINGNISIRINNDSELTTSKEIAKDKYNGKKTLEIFNSNSFKKLVKISDVKTISVDVEFNNLFPLSTKFKCTFAFVKNEDYERIKKDYQISKNFGQTFEYVTSNSINNKNEFKSNYQELFFKPLEISQDKNIIDFMLIQRSNVPFQRPKIDVYKMHNIPFSKLDKKDIDVFLNNDNYVSYHNNTYYDVKEKRVIEGFDENSLPGYIVPYDFSGKIYPYIMFDINGIKDIKISWEWNIDQPYFDEDKGKIKLYLDANNDENNNVSKWFEIPVNFFEDESNKEIKLNEIFEKLEK